MASWKKAYKNIGCIYKLFLCCFAAFCFLLSCRSAIKTASSWSDRSQREGQKERHAFYSKNKFYCVLGTWRNYSKSILCHRNLVKWDLNSCRPQEFYRKKAVKRLPKATALKEVIHTNDIWSMFPLKNGNCCNGWILLLLFHMAKKFEMGREWRKVS